MSEKMNCHKCRNFTTVPTKPLCFLYACRIDCRTGLTTKELMKSGECLYEGKRYKMMTTIIDPFPIWDTVEEKGYNCTDTLSELVNLLNNLTEENEQLKKERMKDAKEFSALFKQNFGLKRENEQLKQTIQKIADLDDLTVEELLESVKCVSEEDIIQYLRCLL